uniref:Uncharacterized protein n=1 Tax=Anguilla anguilla TaxID=7936 RepID=A0A0E9RN63_ANGAN
MLYNCAAPLGVCDPLTWSRKKANKWDRNADRFLLGLKGLTPCLKVLKTIPFRVMD